MVARRWLFTGVAVVLLGAACQPDDRSASDVGAEVETDAVVRDTAGRDGSGADASTDTVDADEDDGTGDVPDAADTDAADTDAADTGAPDADAADTATPDTDAADTDAADSEGDGADTGDSDASDDAPTNACGGEGLLSWEGLPALPDDPCGACGDGALACANTERLECTGARELDACGGCSGAPPGTVPGVPCGECGVYECRDDDLACVEMGDECPPPFESVWRLLPSDAFDGDWPESDTLGRAVLLVDDSLIVSASQDGVAGPATGAVFTYRRTDEGWRHEQSLRPSEPTESDFFGWSLASDGTRLAVGAHASPRAVTGAGAVFVYERVDGEWANEVLVLPPEPVAEGRFGRDVAIDGDTLVVTQHNHYAPEIPGRVFVFELVEGAWELVRTLESPAEPDRDGFGGSVALDGEHMLVGAYLEGDPDTAYQSGNLYAYRRADGAWTPDAVDMPAVVRGDFTGVSVSLDGTLAVVGASNADSGAGAAYVFARDALGWRAVDRLVAESPEVGDFFGDEVHIRGRRILVGAYRQNSSGERSGAVHVFDPDDEDWSAGAVLSPPPGKDGARLGRSLALDGDLVASGAVDDPTAGNDAGAVYLFELDLPSVTPYGPITTPRAVDRDAFGFDVAVDGALVFVGMPDADEHGHDAGAIHVYRRGPLRWQYSHRIAPPDPETGGRFGASLDAAGSLLLVGAPGVGGDDAIGAGAAWLIELDRDGLPTRTFRLDPSTPTAGLGFGNDVVLADGYFIVAADGRAAGDDAVPLHVYRIATEAVEDVGPTGTWFGAPVRTATVGADASFVVAGDPSASAVYLWSFADGVLGELATLAPPDDLGGADFGASVAIGGGTIVVGAPAPGERGGAALVYEHDGSDWVGTPLEPPDDVDLYELGASVAIAPPLIAVGSPGRPGIPGVVLVYRRGPEGWEMDRTLTASTDSHDDGYGRAVTLDAWRLVVGAPRNDDAGSDAGAAFVYE